MRGTLGNPLGLSFYLGCIFMQIEDLSFLRTSILFIIRILQWFREISSQVFRKHVSSQNTTYRSPISRDILQNSAICIK